MGTSYRGISLVPSWYLLRRLVQRVLALIRIGSLSPALKLCPFQSQPPLSLVSLAWSLSRSAGDSLSDGFALSKGRAAQGPRTDGKLIGVPAKVVSARVRFSVAKKTCLG